MRSLLRAVALVAVVAAPAAISAPPASASLVCLYWRDFQVTSGPPNVNIPVLVGADVYCTLQGPIQAGQQVQQQLREVLQEQT